MTLIEVLEQQEEIIRIQNKLIKDMAEMLEQFVGAEGVEKTMGAQSDSQDDMEG